MVLSNGSLVFTGPPHLLFCQNHLDQFIEGREWQGKLALAGEGARFRWERKGGQPLLQKLVVKTGMGRVFNETPGLCALLPLPENSHRTTVEGVLRERHISLI
jgi:hypothetical protein